MEKEQQQISTQFRKKIGDSFKIHIPQIGKSKRNDKNEINKCIYNKK